MSMQYFQLNYHHSALPHQIKLALTGETLIFDVTLSNNCCIINKINISLNILFLLKTVFNASKKKAILKYKPASCKSVNCK